MGSGSACLYGPCLYLPGVGCRMVIWPRSAGAPLPPSFPLERVAAVHIAGCGPRIHTAVGEVTRGFCN